MIYLPRLRNVFSTLDLINFKVFIKFRLFLEKVYFTSHLKLNLGINQVFLPSFFLKNEFSLLLPIPLINHRKTPLKFYSVIFNFLEVYFGWMGVGVGEWVWVGVVTHFSITRLKSLGIMSGKKTQETHQKHQIFGWKTKCSIIIFAFSLSYQLSYICFTCHHYINHWFIHLKYLICMKANIPLYRQRRTIKLDGKIIKLNSKRF